MNRFYYSLSNTIIVLGLLVAATSCKQKDTTIYNASIKKQVDSIFQNYRICGGNSISSPMIEQKIKWKDTIDYKQDTVTLFFTVECINKDSAIAPFQTKHKVVSYKDSILTIQAENKDYNLFLHTLKKLYDKIKDTIKDKELKHLQVEPWIPVTNLLINTKFTLLKSGDSTIKDFTYNARTFLHPNYYNMWEELYIGNVQFKHGELAFNCDTLLYSSYKNSITLFGNLKITTKEKTLTGAKCEIDLSNGNFNLVNDPSFPIKQPN